MDFPEFRLVDYSHPVLSTTSKKFDFSEPPYDPLILSEKLVALMYEKNGIGIAAPQVGLDVSVFAMRNIGSEGDFVCFNPKIVAISQETIELEESCLSFPGLILPIERSRHIRLRFQGPSGETFTRLFTGITARCVQHEMDHLEGRQWFEGRVSRLRLERAIKRSKRNYVGLLKFAQRKE